MSIQLLNSITDADDASAERVVVSGSHGGHFAAYCASRARLRGVILNDAGVGCDRAGVAGVLALADTGMAAATVAHSSCRIGQAEEAHAQGQISVVNSVALELGVEPEMSCQQAAVILQNAPLPHSFLPAVSEVRESVKLDTADSARMVWLLDSASLVSSVDDGRIVITGSHGGLIGTDPRRALKAEASIAVFNDAGVGHANAGITRLPALDKRNIAALTVAHTSARIGDARSMFEQGVISHANHCAARLGATAGLKLQDWLRTSVLI